tara:strand:- start:45 stop:899 length:855 start_codon:yes stop_codon:yes gene_type:complete
MKIFEKTFETYLGILLNLSRDYSYYENKGKTDFSKKVGDTIQQLYKNGYLMAYAIGVSEICKESFFTQKKIDELKKLGEKKTKKEFHKLQKKINTLREKIVLKLILGFKNNKEYFSNQLERHNYIFDLFNYINNEKINYFDLSYKYRYNKIDQIKSSNQKNLKKISDYYKKKFKSKNPYDQFVQPYEENVVKMLYSKELKKLYEDSSNHIIQGFSHGVADIENMIMQCGWGRGNKDYGKFNLAASMHNRTVLFRETFLDVEIEKYITKIEKYNFTTINKELKKS